jgi:hypothetical protein
MILIHIRYTSAQTGPHDKKAGSMKMEAQQFPSTTILNT